MQDPLLVPELKEMLLDNDEAAMGEFCQVLHPAVVAENLEALADEEIWRILAQTDLHRQVEIFEYIPLRRQREMVQHADRQRLAGLIEEMAPDDRADLLAELPTEVMEALLPLVAQVERSEIRKLLSYPDSSAGSLMTTDYASIPGEIEVREAINLLRLQAPNRETIYYVYVIDDERVLRGFITLRKLILARPDRKIADMMDRDVIAVKVTDDQELVASKMARYDFIAMPVVDEQQRLVGIITHDDVLDVVQEEATEDAQRQGAVAPLGQSYLTMPIPILVWKRIVWLVLLFGPAFITAGILNQYQSAAIAFPWIVQFIPLVMASGGNAGSQSATLVIRTLALNEAKVSAWRRLALRELILGLILGTSLATIAFIPAYLLAESNIRGACAVSLTIVVVVLMGTLVGSMLPVIFKSVGMDPALMSNPLIAALVDVSGVVIYYTLVFAIVT